MTKLVVLVTTHIEVSLKIAEAWGEQGHAPGVTILKSHGLASLKKKRNDLELPLFVSIASVLDKIQETTQTLFTVVEDHQVDDMVEIARSQLGDLGAPDSGIVFVINVDRVIGLKNRHQHETDDEG